MPTTALLDDAPVVVALLVAIASLAVSLTTATMTRRHERALERERDEQARRQVEHERLTELYDDMHKAGSDLVVGLRIQEAMRIPRLLRVPLGLRWLRRGSPERDIGHRRAMLELHGAPQDVLDAWERVDAATVELNDAQMARDNVEEAASNVRSSLDAFVAAARDHLAEVWPPAHRHQAPGTRAAPDGGTRDESVPLESDARHAEH